MKECSWCTTEFEPNVKYQIYCSVECRTLSTKEKVSERYKQKRRTKYQGKQRFCAGGCGEILSMYNDTQYCNSCNINEKQVARAIKQIKNKSKGKK